MISSLSEILLLTAVFTISIFWVKSLVISNSSEMGKTAAQMSAKALEAGLKKTIQTHAIDMSTVIDEKLVEIQNFTLLLAAMTTDYFSAPENFRSRALVEVKEGVKPGGSGFSDLYISPNANREQALREARVAGNICDIFEQVNKLDGDITASFAAGESGYFIVTRTSDAAYHNYDARERSWYINAKERGALSWSAVYAGIAIHGPTISCSAPYYEVRGGKRTLKGIAGNGVALTNFERIIEAADPGENAVVFLLDSNGVKLFSSDGSGIKIDWKTGAVVGENLLQSRNDDLRALAVRMTNREDGVMEIHQEKQIQYAAYVPLEVIDWSLGVVIDGREITDPLESISKDIGRLAARANRSTNNAIFFMLLALAAISAAILVYRVSAVFFLARRIAEPITALARQLEDTGGENLTTEVTVNSKAAEIRQLAESFNDMKKRLRLYVAHLEAATTEKQRMSTELELAARIQNSMLPAAYVPPKHLPRAIEIGAQMNTAKECGGDFYDYFFIDDDRFAIVIGDVSGKGVSAAMFMVIAKTLIKNHLREGLPPDEAAEKLNVELCDNNQQGMFVTVWIGVFHPRSGKLEYINAGHNPPLIRLGDGDYRFIKAHGNDLVIGVTEESFYHKHEVTLSHGGSIFLYTDGITEAFNTENDMYGAARLYRVLNTLRALPSKEMLARLYDDILTFAGGAEQSDDITMLVLRYAGSKGAAGGSAGAKPT